MSCMEIEHQAAIRVGPAVGSMEGSNRSVDFVDLSAYFVGKIAVEMLRIDFVLADQYIGLVD